MIPSPHLIRLLDLHAPFGPVPGCPPLQAWSASDELHLWQALEAAEGGPVPVPFYAVAWPGARAVAQFILEGTLSVAGARVLDVGCGSGLLAAAAATHGAVTVGAVDVDPRALMATQELAHRNGCSVHTILGDPLADDAITRPYDVILGADVFYSQDTAARGAHAVRRWNAAGKRVVLADAGRPFFDACGLPLLGSVMLAVPHSVEGRSTRVVRLYGKGK